MKWKTPHQKKRTWRRPWREERSKEVGTLHDGRFVYKNRNRNLRIAVLEASYMEVGDE